jgi:hypothetical protein
VEQSAGVQEDLSTHPVRALKLACDEMKEYKWETIVEGIEGIIKLSRCNTALVESNTSPIYIICSALVARPRSPVAIAACEMARELFETTQCTVNPGFQKIVSALLQRTSDRNTSVKQAANEALDAMAMNISFS